MRIDQGADFLSDTVGAALGAFAVPVQQLPAYRPELKGTVENLNRCVVRMFCASLPRYRHAPSATPRPRRADRDEGEALPFTVFVELLLDWVHQWNTAHVSQPLGGRTPLEAWQDDPTPVEDVDAGLLWAFTLEDDGRVRTLTASGVRWRNRYYVGEWMHGLGRMRVRVRFVPHHDHEIEVFDAATGTHLGPAFLADAATREQRLALRRARDAERRRLVKALAAADHMRYRRYEAVTEPVAPKQLGALTEAEAQERLSRSGETDLAARALPELIPPSAPPDTWAPPVNRPGPPAGSPDPAEASARAGPVAAPAPADTARGER
ncbi:Mu transposase C-terminal domain-containing protein [Streptomyces violascens]